MCLHRPIRSLSHLSILLMYIFCLGKLINMKATSSALRNMKKLDRKTVERNRRIHMKGLCFRLTSLIPPHHLKLSKEFLSQQGQLDQATDYIKQLKERIDELKVKKEVLALMSQNGNSSHPMSASFTVPVVELRESGSSNIEVLVVSDKEKNIRLCDVIKVLQEEGADVVSSNISREGDRVIHTLHAQVKVCRVGVDTSSIWQRLQNMMCVAYHCEDMQIISWQDERSSYPLSHIKM